MSNAVFVGVDVSKTRLDIVTLPDGRHIRVERTIAGLTELIEQLSGRDVHVGVEATDGYE